MASRNRGKFKPKLRDLSRISPTSEELQEVWRSLREGSPITTAILAAGIVEHELETALRACFSRSDDETWKLLTNDNGPLGTFNQKIIAAYGFGIVDDTVKHALDSIRQIRNVFAHTKRLIDFDHELIVQELKKVSLPQEKRSHLSKRLSRVREMESGPTAAYGTLCIAVCIKLLDRRLRQAKARNAARTRRRRQALASALRQPPALHTAGLLRLLTGYPPVDPKKTILGSADLEAQDEVEKSDDNTDT